MLIAAEVFVPLRLFVCRKRENGGAGKAGEEERRREGKRKEGERKEGKKERRKEGKKERRKETLLAERKGITGEKKLSGRGI